MITFDPERYPNFTEEEIVNPVFDDCPADCWAELPDFAKLRLPKILDIVQFFRTETGIILLITSSYRHGDLKAHGQSLAIDCQPPKATKENKDWGHRVIRCMKKQDKFKGFRIIWEYAGNGWGWIHTDSGYADKGENIFWVSYLNKAGKRVFKPYEGKAPWEY